MLIQINGVNQVCRPVRSAISCAEEAIKVHGFLPYHTSNAPTTGAQIKQAFDDAPMLGFMPIFDGGGIMLWSKEANLAYRFVHDIDHALHYDQGRGTTGLKNERFLNCLMAKRVHDTMLQLRYKENLALQAFFIGYADWVGQAEDYAHTGRNLDDQASFVYRYLLDCKGYNLAKAGQTELAKQVMYGCLVDCGVVV